MAKKIIILIFVLLLQAAGTRPVHAVRTLRVGIYQNPPLTFVAADGTVQGIFIDILEHVAQKEGWVLEYVADSWTQNLDNLQKAKIDLLGVIAFTAERSRHIDYCLESVLTEWAQVYAVRGSGIESIIDLDGKKVAVLQNDIHYLVLRELSRRLGIACRFIETFEYEDVLGIVAAGRCDAGLVSQFFGLQYERSYDVLKSPVVLNPQKLYFAVPAGRHRDLLNTLDRHLRILKNDPKSLYHESLNRWLGVGNQPVIAEWVAIILIGTAGLLVFLLVASMILRNRVKSRTRELFQKNEQLRAEIEQRRQAEQERTRLEMRLQRALKMEAIGTLAGGVAHDLNNILSGLIGLPELILLDLPSNSPLTKPLETIQKSGQKAATIVQDLLTLARRGVATTKVLNLNQIVCEYLKSPEYASLRLYHSNVQVETRLDQGLLNINGSPVHLSKTVMNLTSNAAEAMPGGGRLLIATANRSLDRPLEGYYDIIAGDYAVLAVSDTGSGICPEDRDRIFEPFYTKKVMGRSGTGLGMTVVWGAVKDHGGYIEVDSTEGRGTTFSLFFPVSRQELEIDRTPSSWKQFRGNGQKILVVDDIAEQRQVVCSMLERLGYRVAAAANGEEAIAYLKDDSAALLILDMIMDPGIDGLETYRRILALRPGQKAIIASGFSETERVRRTLELGAGAYVKKPFLISTLGQAVKAELSKPFASEM